MYLCDETKVNKSHILTCALYLILKNNKSLVIVTVVCRARPTPANNLNKKKTKYLSKILFHARVVHLCVITGSKLFGDQAVCIHQYFWLNGFVTVNRFKFASNVTFTKILNFFFSLFPFCAVEIFLHSVFANVQFVELKPHRDFSFLWFA